MGIVVVTGSSRGLGRSMALHLADKGHDVVVTYKGGQAQAEEVAGLVEAKGRKAAVLALDVSDSSAFGDFAKVLARALKDTWNREHFDCLVNNAGIGVNAPFAVTTPEQFDQLMNIHLKGPFFLTQRLLPLLRDGGRVVNISTGLTRFAMPGFAAYAAMKGAVEVLTRYMAKELGARGISAVVLAPGAIETDFGGGVVRDDRQVNAHVAGLTALGRVGLPDDIGAAVALLVSEDARWINGLRVEASGGMCL